MSEPVGIECILVCADNRCVNPWLRSQIILENTMALCPFVAVQPLCMHPFSVAMIVKEDARMSGSDRATTRK
jgi:alkanesulfonate monooxygenase